MLLFQALKPYFRIPNLYVLFRLHFDSGIITQVGKEHRVFQNGGKLIPVPNRLVTGIIFLYTVVRARSSGKTTQYLTLKKN
jgi:hypothetical protein